MVRVLVVNAGSSSLKLRRMEGDEAVDAVDLDAPDGRFDDDELAAALDRLGDVDAAGHRVVHGGERFTTAVRIDDEVRAALDDLTPLAPLHQPPALAAIDALARLRPGVPSVACFDTAFHTTIPSAASTYALPAAWRRRWPLRRYGFHGISHQWASRRAAALSGRSPVDAPSGFRVVTCHLGAGASLAAVLDGRSIDTTMGFTPLEGLVMASRSGDVDPGLVLWLLQSGALSAEDVSSGLEHGAGLVGLAGSSDMREVLRRAAAGAADATLAIDVYVHSLCRHLAGMVASLGGIDALVFTGGIGEHAASIRSAAAARLAWLGIAIDAGANEHAVPDADITAVDARVQTFVIAAREDVEIARLVRAVLASDG